MTSQGLECSEWGARAQEAHDSQGARAPGGGLPGPGSWDKNLTKILKTKQNFGSLEPPGFNCFYKNS